MAAIVVEIERKISEPNGDNHLVKKLALDSKLILVSLLGLSMQWNCGPVVHHLLLCLCLTALRPHRLKCNVSSLTNMTKVISLI